MSDIYATIERVNGKLQSRILEPGKEPYVFAPEDHAWFTTKCDLVRSINQAYPGVTVTFRTLEAFDRLVNDLVAS